MDLSQLLMKDVNRAACTLALKTFLLSSKFGGEKRGARIAAHTYRAECGIALHRRGSRERTSCLRRHKYV